MSKKFTISAKNLINDDVMLLDTFTAVYVWIGTEANETEENVV